MVRRSVPASSKWTAKAWRSPCGEMCFFRPARLAACRQASWTALRVIGVPGRSPGKSQCRGRSTFHQARSTASSFGDSIT